MRLRFKSVCHLVLLAAVFCVWSAAAAWCQEKAADKAAEKSDAPPAAPDKADDKAAPEKAASSETPSGEVGTVSPADAFAAKLNQWRELLKELRKVKGQYEESEGSQLVALSKQFDTLAAQGEKLIEELRNAGMKAYAAAPNEDRHLLRFLVQILDDDIARDNYEPAAKLANLLIDNGCDVTTVFRDGGLAAFATNDYDRAEKDLKEFENRGSQAGAGNDDQEQLNARARQFQELIPQYRKYWAEEQAIRKKEAEADDLPRVKLITTKGPITIELFENEAPNTVANFISLVEKGFYDGLKFHRVLKGFMAQGGCPKGDGTGGPGYNIPCECYQDNYRKHFRGSLSMAHAGRDTGGSQFFLTFVPTAHLNGKHTVFGRVIEGMDVLAKLQRTGGNTGQTDSIVKAEVLRKRDHEYVPEKVQ